MGFNEKQIDIINEERKQNILVSAAAGSGKTTVLTERIIRLLSDVEKNISISDILIMTFTKKATSDMKAKINKRLMKELDLVKKELSSGKLDAETKKRKNAIYDKLIKESSLIQNANILTIDAFCKKILEENYTFLSKENSLYYDFDISYKIGDDREMVLLKEEVLTEFFEKNYQNKEYKKLFNSYVEKNNENNLRSLMLFGLYKLSVVPWPIEYLDDQIKNFNKYSNAAYYEYEKKCIESLNEYVEMFKEHKKFADEVKELYKDAHDRKENGKGNKISNDTLNKIQSLIDDLENLIDFYDTFKTEKIIKIDGEQVEFIEDAYNDIIRKLETVLNLKFAFVPKSNFLIDEQDRHNELKEIVASMLKILSSVHHKLRNLKVEERQILNENELLYLKFLKEFYIAFLEEKKKRNTYEISDYSNITLDILYDKADGEYGKGGRKISSHAEDVARKYKLIFIDEYQDTNYVQETIVKALSNDFSTGNVFMVGDVKQSIYRFRNAEPEIFVNRYNDYKGNLNNSGLLKTLDRNYRSNKEIIGYVNDLFTKTMSSKYGDIKYTEGHELTPREDEEKRDIKEENKVEIKVICKNDNSLNNTNIKDDSSDVPNENDDVRIKDEKEKKYSGAEIEADYVAAKIEELVKEKKKKYKDIVILLRNEKGKSKIYEEALLRHKIPVCAEQKTGFFDRLEIQFMLNLLKVIDNPLQNVALASVLYSNIFKFTNDELAFMKVMQNEYFRVNAKTIESNKIEAINLEKYKNYYFNVYDQLNFINKCFMTEDGKIDKNIKGVDNKYEISAVSDEEIDILSNKLKEANIDKFRLKSKIEKILNALNKFKFKSRYMSISDLIDCIYNDLNIKEIMGSMPDGKLRVANLNLLYDLAIRFENSSNVFLFNFNRYIERIKEVDLDAGLAKIYDENADVVRIMTIHKSKGLEFDTVFLCSAETNYNLNDAREDTLYQFNRKIGFGLDCYDVNKKMILSSPKKSLMSEIETDATKQEELRVLYVALTRAINKLYIIGYSAKTGKGFLNKDLDDFEEKKSKKENIDKKIKDCTSYLEVVLSNYPVKNEKYCNYERVEWNVKEVDDIKEEIALETLYDENDREENVANNPTYAKYFESVSSKTLDKNLTDDYKYKYLQDIPIKYSVTGLKAGNESEVDKSEYIIEDDDRDDAVDLKRREDKHEIGGAELGNAYHRYMQFYNYNTGKLQISFNGNVDLSFAKNILADKIAKFLESHIGQEMKQAFAEDRLYREQKFMKLFSKNEIDSWGVSANKDDLILKNEYDEENIIIQGIIDAFYTKTDDKGDEYIVLVDYKTDEINTQNLDVEKFSKVIADRHRLQLDVYSKVLKNLTGMEVREKYIYSFALDKEVRI